MQKHLWKDYFCFSFRERIALLLLLCATLTLIFLPRFFYPGTVEPQPELSATDKAGTGVLVSHAVEKMSGSPAGMEASGVEDVKGGSRLFLFDPNTITEAGLLQLGMRSKTIATLLHYRQKGGQFRYPDDLRKIYGLRKEEADRLVPYVKIPASRRLVSTNNKSEFIRQAIAIDEMALADPISFSEANTDKLPVGKQFLSTNINTATPEDWKRFPGIGEVLSKRIVAFRTKLGSFQSVAQVRQTYGLSDSVFRRMEPYLYLDTVPVRPETVSQLPSSSPGAVPHRKDTPFPRGRLSRYVVLPLDGSPL